ncbi:alpha/beta fold hydrolase [Xenorhabdus szentirmaii]|uniref:Alpha/beta hydrolase fold n=1 Tax=Xenorhabdus szentirmaii DSM 16338 TaxID=1427518 RepID=W1J2R9_9GAMM|nr:alpha/beta hydrolase [Xenorhabdus szentirmaii]PHM34592.1 epoxide hydrolase EphB [Xenorhabdus szentirmaii DSM 16338]CDL85009.1 Alpha/beta hydrolase fold [Xenorhabdus szentirmaii DSM 16338]
MKVTANHISIEVEDSGEKSHPVILLIMGLGMQLIDWPDEIINQLVTAGFRVIRYDNRDAGLSQRFDHIQQRNFLWQKLRFSLGLPVRPPYSLQDMADDALGILDALGISHAHIIGASMGGMIAQRLAATYPERAKSLVSIMSSSGAPRLPHPKPEVMAALLSKPAGPHEDELIAHQLRMVQAVVSPAESLDKEALTRHLRIALRRGGYHPDSPRRQTLAIMADSHRTALLAQIGCPTLVVHGEDDPLIPIACGEDTARRITGAEFVPVQKMGHSFPPTFMQALAEKIIPFLSGISSSP